jgi:hypothetical protein
MAMVMISIPEKGTTTRKHDKGKPNKGKTEKETTREAQGQRKLWTKKM